MSSFWLSVLAAWRARRLSGGLRYFVANTCLALVATCSLGCMTTVRLQPGEAARDRVPREKQEDTALTFDESRTKFREDNGELNGQYRVPPFAGEKEAWAGLLYERGEIVVRWVGTTVPEWVQWYPRTERNTFVEDYHVFTAPNGNRLFELRLLHATAKDLTRDWYAPYRYSELGILIVDRDGHVLRPLEKLGVGRMIDWPRVGWVALLRRAKEVSVQLYTADGRQALSTPYLIAADLVGPKGVSESVLADAPFEAGLALRDGTLFLLWLSPDYRMDDALAHQFLVENPSREPGFLNHLHWQWNAQRYRADMSPVWQEPARLGPFALPGYGGGFSPVLSQEPDGRVFVTETYHRSECGLDSHERVAIWFNATGEPQCLRGKPNALNCWYEPSVRSTPEPASLGESPDRGPGHDGPAAKAPQERTP